jgi:hypothetical protein
MKKRLSSLGDSLNVLARIIQRLKKLLDMPNHGYAAVFKSSL